MIAGRGGEVVQASLTVPNKVPRIDVSGYNLWYLLRLGDVHNVSSALHPGGPPLTYREIGIVLSVTFLFNLVTIAPFTPTLGTNLVAAQPDSARVIVLKGISLLTAVVNIVVLTGLVAYLASEKAIKDKVEQGAGT